jgi:hypothetical protein
VCVDKTPSEQAYAPRSDFHTGFFRLDHAREEVVRQIGDLPLDSVQARWLTHALAMYDYSDLEALASILAAVRRDGAR